MNLIFGYHAWKTKSLMQVKNKEKENYQFYDSTVVLLNQGILNDEE